MIVKTDNSKYVGVLASIIVELLAIADGMNTWFFLLFWFTFDIYLIIDTFVTCRTLIFDEKGCCIRFFKYEKFYNWDDVVIKRRESNYRNRYKPREGVFFSVKQVHKPKRKDPAVYCTFKHPFSCFFVYLATTEQIQKITKMKYFIPVSEKILLADKEEFLCKMKEWGIELTEE